jgi:hypothetical protein
MLKTRLLALASVAAGFALGAPVVAQAQEVPGLGDGIVLAGFATIASGTGGDCGNTPFVCLVGGTGTYNYSTLAAVCYSDPAELSATVTTVSQGNPCTVTVANGTFQNTVCGTGFAQGVATVTGEPEGSETANFDIAFVATVGIITPVATVVTSASTLNSDQAEGLAGVVEINADPFAPIPNPAAFQCAGGFSVTGVVASAETSGP